MTELRADTSRAANRRALRAVGYRGSKSRRNRLTKEQAAAVVAEVRLRVADRMAGRPAHP